MTSDWESIASCVSAGVAILALFVSLRQVRMANRQSLFDRRLKIWLTVEKLMQVYQKNSGLLSKDDGLQSAVGPCFKWLTNTTFLQEISPAISHTLENEHQLKLHLKLDEMKSLSAEAAFVFKGRSKTAIAEFIDAYQSLLFKMYQYQILLNVMQADSKKYHWTLEKVIDRHGEKRHRMELFNAEDRLAVAYEKLVDKRLMGDIQRQIRLDSTPGDYLGTFR